MANIVDDLRSIKKRDPACRNALEVILLYSGFHALVFYRIAHAFYKCHLFFLARLVSQLGRFFTGIEIHPGARIGRGLFIDHGSGVVIGETAEVGDYCTLYQGVTLGGTGKDTGKRHPTLGNNVLVGSGAKVLGPLNIGDGVKIAAGAVVLRDVPAHSTAVGVPARIILPPGAKAESNLVSDHVSPLAGVSLKKPEGRENADLDQIHIPDPISQELFRLTRQLDQLQQRVKELESEKN
ncbi:MAG: serine O-acetyltransferase [Clostridiales bacterium]|nr:serine O-acetyltransferase [Clostridiales bacterium]